MIVGGLLASCHAPGALHDVAPKAAAQAYPPAPAAERAAEGEPLITRSEPSEFSQAPALSELSTDARSAPWQLPTNDIVNSVGEQFADPVRGRIEALERNVAALESLLRAQAKAPEPGPSAADRALGLLPVLLGLLTLLAVASAIAAIARAHRTRTEVTRLQAASKLLAERAGSASDDELSVALHRILRTGA